MAYFKIVSGKSHAVDLLINAVNRLRLAKEELETAEALIANMDNDAIVADIAFTGTGDQLRDTLSGSVVAMNSASMTNLLETLNW